MTTKAYLAAAIVALSATSASAAIVSVSGPTSIIDPSGSATPGPLAQKIGAPDNVLDNNVTNTGMQGFDEQQNVSLSGALTVDGGTIAAGTVVDSHMIFLNSDGRTRISHGLDSAVEWMFDGTILGVMSDFLGALEVASTPDLGDEGTTTYPTATFRARGLEGSDFYSFTGNTLSIGMEVTEPGDWVRVVTATPVPLPAAGVLLLGALGGLGGASALRRRRKTA